MSCHIQSHKTPCALCHSSLHQREPVLWNRKRGKSTMKWGFGNELFLTSLASLSPFSNCHFVFIDVVFVCLLVCFIGLVSYVGRITGACLRKIHQITSNREFTDFQVSAIFCSSSICPALRTVDWFSLLSVAFCAFADNLNAIIPNTRLITCDWQCLGICASCSYHPFMQRLF